MSQRSNSSSSSLRLGDVFSLKRVGQAVPPPTAISHYNNLQNGIGQQQSQRAKNVNHLPHASLNPTGGSKSFNESLRSSLQNLQQNATINHPEQSNNQYKSTTNILNMNSQNSRSYNSQELFLSSQTNASNNSQSLDHGNEITLVDSSLNQFQPKENINNHNNPIFETSLDYKNLLDSLKYRICKIESGIKNLRQDFEIKTDSSSRSIDRLQSLCNNMNQMSQTNHGELLEKLGTLFDQLNCKLRFGENLLSPEGELTKHLNKIIMKCFDCTSVKSPGLTTKSMAEFKKLLKSLCLKFENSSTEVSKSLKKFTADFNKQQSKTNFKKIKNGDENQAEFIQIFTDLNTLKTKIDDLHSKSDQNTTNFHNFEDSHAIHLQAMNDETKMLRQIVDDLRKTILLPINSQTQIKGITANSYVSSNSGTFDHDCNKKIKHKSLELSNDNIRKRICTDPFQESTSAMKQRVNKVAKTLVNLNRKNVNNTNKTVAGKSPISSYYSDDSTITNSDHTETQTQKSSTAKGFCTADSFQLSSSSNQIKVSRTIGSHRRSSKSSRSLISSNKNRCRELIENMLIEREE